MSTLKPVVIAPEPSYPSWAVPTSRTKRSLQSAVARTALAAVLMFGGCGVESNGDGATDPDAAPDATIHDGSLEPDSAADAGAHLRADGGSPDSAPSPLMAGANVGMPLALGLDPSDREPALPRNPDAPPPPTPMTPSPPLVTPPSPQVWYPAPPVALPKPPWLASQPPARPYPVRSPGGPAPIRISGSSPQPVPVRLAGRTPPVRLPQHR